MRQFLSSADLDIKGRLFIRGKELHYLSGVLRLSAGSSLEVRLPGGELRLMTVESADKKEMVLISAPEILNQKNICSSETGVKSSQINTEIRERMPEIWLFQFIAKPQKMDDIIRQSTECGVSVIVPVIGDYSAPGAQISASRAERWNRVIREARQQCGSPVETRITDSCTVEDAAAMWADCSVEKKNAFVLSEMPSDGPVKSVFQQLREKPDAVCIAVGCEGGVSEREMGVLLQEGFTRLHFSTNILRAETAAVYGIAVVQNALLEFETWHTNE
jgi:16S rRNA (uracil1498-N3)-methyltransferase